MMLAVVSVVAWWVYVAQPAEMAWQEKQTHRLQRRRRRAVRPLPRRHHKRNKPARLPSRVRNSKRPAIRLREI
jgi:hypothetical protein